MDRMLPRGQTITAAEMLGPFALMLGRAEIRYGWVQPSNRRSMKRCAIIRRLR
jgi:hypothetical protein